MSEPAIVCEKCGKKFCRSEGNMSPYCGTCDYEIREKESLKRHYQELFGDAYEGENVLKKIMGKKISGWKIVFAERRGRQFKVIFQHLTSNEVKIVQELDFVWKEQGLPVLLAKSKPKSAAELGHLCTKCGDFYHGDFCTTCTEETFEEDEPETGKTPMIEKEKEMNGPDLTERRAIFVYDGARLAAIAAKAPIVPKPWAEREDAFKKQFREVIDRQCGPMRSKSPEELHGGWMQAYIEMGWTHGEKYDPDAKTHPDLVPYDQLENRERDKDEVFIALCEIARQWIYDKEEGK